MRDFGVEHDGRDAGQVIDARLRHGCARVGAQDQGGVDVSANEQVDRREFARVEARVAAAEIDAERDSRWSSASPCRPGDIAVSAHGHGDELCEGIHLGGERQDGGGVHVLAAGHRQAHAEEDHAEAAALHPVGQVLQLLEREARLGDKLRVHGLALDEGRSVVRTSKSLPGRICRKMSTRLSLGVSRISTSTIVRPLRPLGTNFPFCVSVYLVKCRGWHSAGIAAPVDDEVGPVLDFAERAGHLATQLGGDFRGTVS